MIPLIMYMAWCVAVLGGGLDTGIGLGGSLMTIFSAVTVTGSSMGALMSLSEEFEILLGQEKTDTYSLPSVALPVTIALLTGQLFASDISDALKVAGSFGSPFLYGLIPVAMAWAQQQQQQQQPVGFENKSLIPGGISSLGVLGLGATALVGCELAETVGQFL